MVIFLKYELTEKSLTGAFIIPDKTQIVGWPDQIAFLFDTSHSALNITSEDIQHFIFMRDGVFEYYKGVDENANSGLVGSGFVELVENSTMRDSKNINYSSLNLDSPFFKIDYSVKSANDGWNGEFKIYFEENPELMGFGIQQEDILTTEQGDVDTVYINFPKNDTRTEVPSSWGDISFFELDKYIGNIQNFCPDARPYISSDNVAVLCSSLNQQSIDEKDEGDVVFVTGKFANLITGTGISDDIGITLKDQTGTPLRLTVPVNSNNGTFSSAELATKGLQSGLYKVEVDPQSTQYQDLVSINELSVNPHPLTVEDFGTYIGVAVAIIGAIVFLPQLRNYISGRKQRHNMAKEVDELNQIYDSVYVENSPDRDSQEKAVSNLIRRRNKVLTMFEGNKLSQEQYNWLDNKISEYIDKFQQSRAA